MSIYIAIILGLIQGLSEFLPISSSGHLVLFENIFNININNVTFNIILHLATAFSIIVVFRKRIWEMIKHPFCKFNILLLFSTLITGIIALIFKDTFTNSYSNDTYIFGFIVTIFILCFADYAMKKNVNEYHIDFKSASVVGLFQGIAIFPGVSRSGSTVSSLMICGVNKEEALDFSFLLSLPVIFGGCILDFLNGAGNALKEIGAMNVIVGFFTAFVSGILAIKFMLTLVKKRTFKPFIIYLILLSVFLLLNKYVFCLF